jgi:peptidoglycan/LPS O-acetylase OafA/YrhL
MIDYSLPASSKRKENYRPDIDGLRALAVLPVLLFHAKLGCPGGFVGVDIFFVISGFLISTLILKELGDGTFNLITFWERRIRRILPALAVVVFATIVAGWFLFLPQDFKTVGECAVAQAILLSNVFFWQQDHSGYFATGNETKPLLHTWSLAVEEQFYLLFPLFLIFLALHRKLTLSKTIAALAIGSFALSVFGSHSHLSATFYWLPTRAWELMLGALLATTGGKLSASKKLRDASAWLGVGLVFFSIFFYDENTRFPGLAAIPPCLGAALIIFSSETTPSLVGEILTFKPVVFIGLISYSLYLWHWPLLAFTKYLANESQWQHADFRVALLLVSFLLAILSWRYIEIPIRKRRILYKRPQIFGFACVSMITLLLLGLMIFLGHGVPSRFPAKALNYYDSRNHFPFRKDISLEQAMAGQFVELGSRDTDQPIKVLIWGDSHAMAVAPVLDDLCRQFSWRGILAAHSSTAPVLGWIGKSRYGLNENSPMFNNATLNFISQKHVKKVILVDYWTACPGSDSDYFKTNLFMTIHTLIDMGVKTYFLEDVPIQDCNVPRMAAVTAMHNGNLELLGITQEKHQITNRKLKHTYEQIAQMGATVLDPSKYFLNSKGLYGAVKNGQVLYCDEQHLTVEGAELLSPLFEPIFNTKLE